MNKQVIVVNDIAASPGGGLTVLREFYNAIMRNTDDIHWIFLLSEAYVEENSKVSVVLLPKIKKHLKRIIFDSISGAAIINKYKPAVVVSLQNTIVMNCSGKTITYVHQPLPFQKTKSYSLFKPNEFRLACIQHLLGMRIKKSIKKSDLVVVQTKWMESEIKALGIRSDRIKQIYPEMPSITNKAIYETTSSFFYPTSTEPYKNNSLLVLASQRLKKDGFAVKTIMTIEGDDDAIEYIGRVPTETVYKLYQDSCLVFPSYVETFGYPLVEARSAGSLILASDCAFSHELLDGYSNAYFFNPFDENQLYDLMRKVANGEIKRNKASDNSPFNYNNKNSWDYLVDIILSIRIENGIQ